MKTKKIRLEDVKEFKGETIKVFKSDFEIFEFADGFYGISIKGLRGDYVFGGDSAWQDSYDKQLMKNILKNWDGTLIYQGNQYGYRINL